MIPKIVVCLLLHSASGVPLVPTNKLSLATWGSYYEQDHKGPGTYAFGYDIEDPVTGNVQFRQEERHPNGTVTGNYGYVDANGKPHVVTYVSDQNGYRAKVEVEEESAQQRFPEPAPAAAYADNDLGDVVPGDHPLVYRPSPIIYHREVPYFAR